MDETGTSTVLSEAASSLQNLPIAYLLNVSTEVLTLAFYSCKLHLMFLYDYQE